MKLFSIKIALLAAIIFANSNVTFAREKWRNPEVYSINKLEPHAEFTTYLTTEDALQPLDLENPWRSEIYQSLNGIWDFNWYGNVDDVPADWYKTNTTVANWSDMPVPGTWQANGFDKLYYQNIYIPFMYTKNSEKYSEKFLPETIEESKATGYIPKDKQRVGLYRKVVNISAEKLSNNVILRIGSVEAGIEIYVNGKEVGYSQDSFLPAEFNIAPYLKGGDNLIAFKVYRWTDGSYMEVQDMIRWAGIYRDVYLKFNKDQNIRDIQFVGTPDKSLKSVDANYKISLTNSSDKSWKNGKVEFNLYPNGSTKAVKSWSRDIKEIKASQEITTSGSLTLTDVKLWSPDLPNLYTLTATLLDSKGNILEVARIDAGFKRFEEFDGNFFLNGQRYFLKGVNRHEHHPVYGHHVPLECMIRDIELMKQNNINTVRTCHYPNDERWYYLCNRYGITLIDEGNVESHCFGNVPNNRPEWIPGAVDRIKRLVHRDINNPAVLIWSLGNEQGWGWCEAFDQQYDKAKEIDPSRFVMCDRGVFVNDKVGGLQNPVRLDKPDFISPMYNAVNRSIKYMENRGTDKRPFFMCEYSHAMGNAVGSLKETWEHFYANENNGLNGGCIWDWVDQGVQAIDENGEIYYQFGGDWGDISSAQNFCLNGLILPDRSSTPKLAEVKKCYEPFFVTANSLERGEFSLKNRLTQQSTGCYATKWELLENGDVIESGDITVDVPAGESKDFTIPYNYAKLGSDKEYILRVSFDYKENTLWAKKGDEVTFSEFKLKGNYNYNYTLSADAPKVTEAANEIVVSTINNISIKFNKTTGMLSSINVKGNELLTSTDRDRLFDNTQAWVDNLFAHATNQRIRIPKLHDIMYDSIARVASDAKINITKEDKFVVIEIKNSFMSPKNAGFNETQQWKINGLGEIEVSEVVTPEGELKAEDWIPRIGLRIPLTPKINNVTYYGLGPQETFIDRAYGAWTGVFSSKVADSYTPYPRPQDCGNREQVRWMSLTDNSGNGIKVIAPDPLAIGVLPYTQDELGKCRHTCDLPEQSTTTELRVAKKVTGIGNNSCGPLTIDKYRTTTGDSTEYKFYIIPFAM